jgi:acetyl esterase/lipase
VPGEIATGEIATGEVRVDETVSGVVLVPPGAGGTTVLYLPDAPDCETPSAATLATCRELALATGATVVVCRYRPAYRPGFTEDVLPAYRHCQATGDVVLAGERMGATLAAALLVQLRDWGAPAPRRASLVAGLLDLTLESNSVTLNVRPEPAYDRVDLAARVAAYAGRHQLTDPLLSPLYANLHGLPPVQLLVAGRDLLLDDTLSFAARAARSGVSVDLRVWPDVEEFRARVPSAMAAFLGAGSPSGCAGEPSGLVAG